MVHQWAPPRHNFFALALLFAVLNVSSGQELCNICGCLNCTFADPGAVVDFESQGMPQKLNCAQLQQQVEQGNTISIQYCQETLWKLAFEPCKCFHLDNQDEFLSDIPGYGDREYGNSGLLVDTPPENPASLEPTLSPTTEVLYLEVNFTMESCEPLPWGLECTQVGEVISPNGTTVEFTMEIGCKSREGENVLSDFRRGVDCTCNFELLNETDRNCRCSVCPEGFGDGPVAIQCIDDGYLIDECSRVDCSQRCDGTCERDCDNSGFECPLCNRDPIQIEDLMPECQDVNTFLGVLDCLTNYSDPTCFTENTTENVPECVFPHWDPDPNEDTPLVSAQVGACFEDVASCIHEKVDDVFVDQPNCTQDSSLALAQCLIDNTESCAIPCANLSWSYSFRELIDEDLETCQNVTMNLMDPMCELISCCPSCLAELDTLTSCLAEEVFEFNDTCALPCLASDKARRLTSVTDLVITRSSEVAFSRCAPSDDDSGSRSTSLWLAFADCIIDEVLGLFDNVLLSPAPTQETTQSPTANPSTSLPTSSPTIATPPETSPPTPASWDFSYTYNNLIMRLEGATKDLTASSRAAFEDATEELYQSIIAPGTAQRRLQGTDIFDAFLTDVTATGASIDTEGITITYDQAVSFRLASGSLSKGQTLDILLKLIEEDENQQTYVGLLRQRDQDFQSVTQATTNPSDDSDDDEVILGLSLEMLIVYILVICLVPCCCCIIGYYVYKRRSNASEKLTDFNQKNEMEYVAPGSGEDGFAEERFADEGAFGQDSEFGGPDKFSDDGEVFGHRPEAFMGEFGHQEGHDDDHNEEGGDEDESSVEDEIESAPGSESSGDDEEESGSESSEDDEEESSSDDDDEEDSDGSSVEGGSEGSSDAGRFA